MWRRVIGVCRSLRAPKKEKKSADKAAVISQDLINIFVDKKDPEFKSLDQYPPWLNEMLLNHDTERADQKRDLDALTTTLEIMTKRQRT